MNVLIFSMTPLFPDFAMGGAQVQLKKIASHLGTLGHDVKILCTRRDAEQQGFFWLPNVEILPILRFKQPYPEPYFTPVYNIANALQDVNDYLQWADVHFSNDGGLVFPYVYQHLPTVISLRSIIFAETLQSAYLFDGDKLIVPSQYMKDCLIATVGRFFPDLSAKIQVIHNGFDFERFRPTPPDQLTAYLPDLDTTTYQYILFPHRPEASKGFLDCVAVVEKLVFTYGLHAIRVLVPEWMQSAQSPEDRKFYQALRDQLAERNLTQYFIFHEWIPETLLPEYYSIGALTLVIGAYIETFGNVCFESSLCETPVILSKVAPNRTLIPDRFVYKVDYGDTETIAQIASQILTTRERVSAETLTYIQQNFPLEKMVGTFAERITHAKKTRNLTYQPTLSADQAEFALSPWCYPSKRGIFHDFNGTYQHHETLERLLDEQGIYFNASTAHEYGIDRAQIETFIRDGYLYPVNPAIQNTAYVMLGSNANPQSMLRSCVHLLKKFCHVEAVSAVYESPDVNGIADNFFNVAVKLTSHHTPEELKYHILRVIEHELGRNRATKQIVTMDCDIALFNHDVIENMKIPDPALLKHVNFVMPLAEIAPHVAHPITGERLADIQTRLPQNSAIIRHDDWL
jgi:2-amino-4-hydroxy-6-hydroxymethyldihydropteridine diphosphokinase